MDKTEYFVAASEKCYLKKRIGNFTFDMFANENPDRIMSTYNKIISGELMSDSEIYDDYNSKNNIKSFFEFIEFFDK